MIALSSIDSPLNRSKYPHARYSSSEISISINWHALEPTNSPLTNPSNSTLESLLSVCVLPLVNKPSSTATCTLKNLSQRELSIEYCHCLVPAGKVWWEKWKWGYSTCSRQLSRQCLGGRLFGMYSYQRADIWTSKCQLLLIKAASGSNSTSKTSSTSRYLWIFSAKIHPYPASSHPSIPNSTQISLPSSLSVALSNYHSLPRSCSIWGRVVATHVCTPSTTPKKKPVIKKRTYLWLVSRRHYSQLSVRMG